jgi:predicted ATPase/class 3 adenylate cyclase/DNA-binding CsgD family transcriptional regulator
MGEGTSVLPSGTVTLVLGDVEGSTVAWETDPKAMTESLAGLNVVVDEAVGRCGGVRPVEQGEGDSFVAAFDRARDAVACALAIQLDLAGGGLRLRIGVHAGDVLHRGQGNYAGPAVNRAARIRNAAHGAQTVLSQAAAELAADNLPDGASLRDLGVHRLKDLSRPERIFQLCHPDLPAVFPPLRGLDVRAHNLPVQRTSLVGRGAELGELTGLMAGSWLVTLVGSGGCGKTRLAVHAAAELLDDYPDGVWLAELAAVADPAAVASQVASVFALKEGPGMTAADALAAYLGQKQALVVLDNCEHVLDAVAALADRLASACPHLRVLATSRQPLGLPGEVTWRVPSLGLPADDDAGVAGLAGCEAVQLFVERAGHGRPGFALSEANSAAVADICRRLDGIPLAIELAAARVRVFTPAQIAAGLDQRFALLTGAPRTALPRQQTLEASVDWSHDLLTGAEQAVFRRLAVFAGDFDYDAAVAVSAAPPIAPHQVLDQLSLLVDKSLVLVDDHGPQARYRLLETVRDYAAARLAQTDEDTTTRTAHRDHYLAFAEDAEPHLEGAGQTEWMARVAADYPNLRAALAWSRDHGDNERLARMAAAIHLYWGVRGPNTDGVAWLEATLDADRGLPPRLRAKTLMARAHLAAYNFDVVNLGLRAQQGIDAARDLGDDRLTARCLAMLAQVAFLIGRPDGTVDEAEALARQVGDPWALASSLMLRGAALYHNKPAAARRHYEEARRVAETAGDMASANIAAGFQAGTLCLSGELRQARALCDRVTAAAVAGGDRMTVAMTTEIAAVVLVDADERDEALLYADRLERAATELDMHLWRTYVPFIRSQIALANGDGQAALRLAGEAADLARAPVTRAEMLPALVEAELAVGRLPEADSHLDELASIGQSGFGYYLALAHVLRARRLRMAGKFTDAESTAHDGLSLAVDIAAITRIVDALEVLAAIAADLGSHQEAARIFGAARRVRDHTGYRRCVSGCQADVEAVRATLGDEGFLAAWEEGGSLSLDEAVAYARRGRGERKRPATGWASLTPAEINVAALVKDGLSNSEIGQRLLCSARTVQAHLTHIYGKLGVSGRAELVAEAMRQQT